MERGHKTEDGMHGCDVIKGYELETGETEKETMRYLRVMWINRVRHERWRYCGLE